MTESADLYIMMQFSMLPENLSQTFKMILVTSVCTISYTHIDAWEQQNFLRRLF